MPKNKITNPDLKRRLSGAPYPAARRDLIEYARNKGADDAVLDLLLTLPDKEFKNESEVVSSLK